jgi:hypothetical protein
MGKITLILLFLFTIGCSEKFPVDELTHINLIKQLCEVYKIDKENITFKYDRDLPFDNCSTDFYGFNAEDSAKVTSWMRRAKKKAKR